MFEARVIEAVRARHGMGVGKENRALSTSPRVDRTP
jgi:hypothetical protein